MRKAKLYLGCPYCWKPLELVEQKTLTLPRDSSLSIKHYTCVCPKCEEEHWEDEGIDYVSQKDRLFTCRVEITDHKASPGGNPMLKQKIIKKKPQEKTL